MSEPPAPSQDYVFQLRPITLDAYVTGQTILFEPYRKAQRRVTLAGLARFLLFTLAGGAIGLAISYYRIDAELEIYAGRLGQSRYFDGLGVTALAVGLLLIGIGAGILILRASGKGMLSWIMQNSAALRDPGRIAFSATGLSANAPSGQRNFPWATISGYKRAKGHWFIIVDTVTFYWLSDDMVADPAAFAAYLDHNIAAAISAAAPPPQT